MADSLLKLIEIAPDAMRAALAGKLGPCYFRID